MISTSVRGSNLIFPKIDQEIVDCAFPPRLTEIVYLMHSVEMRSVLTDFHVPLKDLNPLFLNGTQVEMEGDEWHRSHRVE